MSTAPEQIDYPHVEHDESGVPFIDGTTMKVVELVMAQRAHGWSPEELSFQYPHLRMAQIHSALAYYWDHQEALDRYRSTNERGRRDACGCALAAG